MVIVDPDHIWVRVAAPQTDAGSVAVGDSPVTAGTTCSYSCRDERGSTKANTWLLLMSCADTKNGFAVSNVSRVARGVSPGRSTAWMAGSPS